MDFEKYLIDKAIDEVIALTKLEKNMLKARIVPESPNGIDQVTSVTVETVHENFDWCIGLEEQKHEIDILKLEVNNLNHEVNSLMLENINFKQENINLNDKVSSLILENNDFKQEVNSLKLENNDFKQKISSIEDKMNYDDQLLYLHDLIRMYRFYFADSIIINKFRYEKWGSFVEEIEDMKDKLESGEISESVFNNFVVPINKELQIDIISLLKFNEDRNSKCHSDIRSSTGQLAFINFVKTTNFYDDFKPIVKKMLEKLEGVKLKRMK